VRQIAIVVNVLENLQRDDTINRGNTRTYTHTTADLVEILFKQAVDPRLGDLERSNLVGNVATLY